MWSVDRSGDINIVCCGCGGGRRERRCQVLSKGFYYYYKMRGKHTSLPTRFHFQPLTIKKLARARNREISQNVFVLSSFVSLQHRTSRYLSSFRTTHTCRTIWWCPLIVYIHVVDKVFVYVRLKSELRLNLLIPISKGKYETEDSRGCWRKMKQGKISKER